MLLGAVVVLLSAFLLPGGARALASISLRWQALLPAALGLQVLVLGVFDDAPHAVVVAGHLLSYLVAAVFVWRNRRVPGLAVLAVGAACNAITITLNGGTLPASADALRTAGRPVEVDGFTNSGVLQDPLLPWLGDVFAVPAWFPFANVFSVGDVLILLGAALVVHGHRLGPAPAVPVDALAVLPRPDLVEEVRRARAVLQQVQQRHLALSALAGTAPAAFVPVVVVPPPRPRLVEELPAEEPVVVTAPAAPVSDALLALPRQDLLAEITAARAELARVQQRHDALHAEVARLLAAQEPPRQRGRSDARLSVVA